MNIQSGITSTQVLSPARGGVRATLHDTLEHSTRSVASGSIANSQAGLQHALERRVDWLEEDLGVTQRRLRDTFGLGPGGGKDAGVAGMTGLVALAQGLETELNNERAWRASLEAQLLQVYESLRSEQADRDESLRRLQDELELTMQGLVDKIEGSLRTDKHVLSERAAKTETALHTLIARVESSIASGGRSLQETLSLTGNGLASPESSSITAHRVHADPDTTSTVAPSSISSMSETPAGSKTSSNAFGIGPVLVAANAVGSAVAGANAAVQTSTRDCEGSVDIATAATKIAADAPSSAAQPLVKIWSELQEENYRLRQRRTMLSEKQSELRVGGPQKGEEADQPQVKQSSVSAPSAQRSPRSSFGNSRPQMSPDVARRILRPETTLTENGSNPFPHQSVADIGGGSSAEMQRPGHSVVNVDGGLHLPVNRYGNASTNMSPPQPLKHITGSPSVEALRSGVTVSTKVPHAQKSGSSGLVNVTTQQHPPMRVGRQLGTSSASAAPVSSSSAAVVSGGPSPVVLSAMPAHSSMRPRSPPNSYQVPQRLRRQQ